MRQGGRGGGACRRDDNAEGVTPPPACLSVGYSGQILDHPGGVPRSAGAHRGCAGERVMIVENALCRPRLSAPRKILAEASQGVSPMIRIERGAGRSLSCELMRAGGGGGQVAAVVRVVADAQGSPLKTPKIETAVSKCGGFEVARERRTITRVDGDTRENFKHAGRD